MPETLERRDSEIGDMDEFKRTLDAIITRDKDIDGTVAVLEGKTQFLTEEDLQIWEKLKNCIADCIERSDTENFDGFRERIIELSDMLIAARKALNEKIKERLNAPDSHEDVASLRARGGFVEWLAQMVSVVKGFQDLIDAKEAAYMDDDFQTIMKEYKDRLMIK